MRGAVDYLADHEAYDGSGVGSVGFCLGGGLSVWAATANPKVDAVVTYYYVMPHGKPDFSKVDAPVLGHFGTADDFVPVDDAKALEKELERRRRRREVRVLRGRRARLLQRHEPPRHLRRGARAGLVAEDDRLLQEAPRLRALASIAAAHPPARRRRRSCWRWPVAATTTRRAPPTARCDTVVTEPQTTSEARTVTETAPADDGDAPAGDGHGGGHEKPEDGPGGAGDEEPARSEAVLTGSGGRITPARGARSAVHRRAGGAALGRRAGVRPGTREGDPARRRRAGLGHDHARRPATGPRVQRPAEGRRQPGAHRGVRRARSLGPLPTGWPASQPWSTLAR